MKLYRSIYLVVKDILDRRENTPTEMELLQENLGNIVPV